MRLSNVSITCCLFVFLSIHNSEATTFAYNFSGVANVQDELNELGLMGTDPNETIQLPFTGSFLIDEDFYFYDQDSLYFPVCNFLLDIGGNQFFFDQIGNIPWECEPDGTSLLVSMGISSTLENILDEHWFEIFVFFDVATPLDITGFNSGFLSLVAGAIGPRRGDVFFSGEVNNLNMQPTNPVPEPSTIFLLGSGLVGFAWYARKRKKT